MNGGPGSNKSTTSTSSSSSGSISASTNSANKAKSRRQTIATLAAAAAAQKPTQGVSPAVSSTTTLDLQRNLVALATQIGLNKAALAAAGVNGENQQPQQQQQHQVQHSNVNTVSQPAQQTTSFDQIIQEMTMGGEKSKLLATHTPKVVHGSKHIKKQHLLSASLNASPNGLAGAQNMPNPTGGNLNGQKVPKGKLSTFKDLFKDFFYLFLNERQLT